jgi:hypothetical protein
MPVVPVPVRPAIWICKYQYQYLNPKVPVERAISKAFYIVEYLLSKSRTLGKGKIKAERCNL